MLRLGLHATITKFSFFGKQENRKNMSPYEFMLLVNASVRYLWDFHKVLLFRENRRVGKI